jgi:hypothetical protein
MLGYGLAGIVSRSSLDCFSRARSMNSGRAPHAPIFAHRIGATVTAVKRLAAPQNVTP